MPAFGKKGGVCLIDGFFQGWGVDSTVVDEEEKGGFLDVVVCIGCVARGGESVGGCGGGGGEREEFGSNGAAVDLTDAVDRVGCGGDRNRGTGFAVFFAGKRDIGAVDGVAAYNVEDLGVFFAGGFEGLLALFDVVKEVFYL